MPGTPQWLRDAQFFTRRLAARLPNRHFSTFGEQELIDKYIDELGIQNRVVVDIGAGDGIRGSNSYALFLRGWAGVGIEADRVKYRRLQKAYSSLPGARAVNALVQPDDVNDLLRANGVDREPGIISLDIDGNDYWVLDAILADFRPKLIVSEYNEKIPPPIRFVVNYDPNFTLRHHFFGYSIAKLADLLIKHNYVLLAVEYNNVLIAPAETPGVVGVSVDQAYRTGYADRPDRRKKFGTNENMEELHSLSPSDGLAFLERFYEPYKGSYAMELPPQ